MDVESLTLQAPTFYVHTDPDTLEETYTCDFLPPYIAIDDALWPVANDRVLKRIDDKTMRIETENACCTYKLVKQDVDFRRSYWLAQSG